MTTLTDWQVIGGPRGGRQVVRAFAASLLLSLGCSSDAKVDAGQDQPSGSAGQSGLGGDVGNAGAAAVESSAGATSIAGMAGTAGVAGAANTETLTQVIERFCAIPDVLACKPTCVTIRQAEARSVPSCSEMFRQLMLCQASVESNLRYCEKGAVTSPTVCIDQNAAYAACVGL